LEVLIIAFADQYLEVSRQLPTGDRNNFGSFEFFRNVQRAGSSAASQNFKYQRLIRAKRGDTLIDLDYLAVQSGVDVADLRTSAQEINARHYVSTSFYRVAAQTAVRHSWVSGSLQALDANFSF
jgi:hypothetical protein